MRLVAAIQSGSLDLKKFAQNSRSSVMPAHTVYSIRHIILDEADRMLDPEFYAQIIDIVAACTHPTVQKAVFSATLPASAEEIALKMMHDPIRVVVGLKYNLSSLKRNTR